MNQQPAPRSTLTSWIWFALLAAALLLIVLIKPFGPRNGTSHPAVGRPLDVLNFDPLTEGARPLTAADLEGKVVLINFWGTWCKPCRVEFPHIEALAKQHRQRDDF